MNLRFFVGCYHVPTKKTNDLLAKRANILRTMCLMLGITVPKRYFVSKAYINQYVVTVCNSAIWASDPRCGILLAFSQLRFLEKTKWSGIIRVVMKYHQPKQCSINKDIFENWHRFVYFLIPEEKWGMNMAPISTRTKHP